MTLLSQLHSLKTEQQINYKPALLVQCCLWGKPRCGAVCWILWHHLGCCKQWNNFSTLHYCAPWLPSETLALNHLLTYLLKLTYLLTYYSHTATSQQLQPHTSVILFVHSWLTPHSIITSILVSLYISSLLTLCHQNHIHFITTRIIIILSRFRGKPMAWDVTHGWLCA